MQNKVKPPVVRPQWYRERVVTLADGPSKTKQSHAESCDVNAIIRQYDRTGQLPAARVDAMYGDVTALNAYYTDVINESDALIAKAKSDLAQYEAKKAEQEEQRKRDLQKAEAEQQKSTESDPVKE